MKFLFYIFISLTIFIQCKSTKHQGRISDVANRSAALDQIINEDTLLKNHFVGVKVYSITENSDIYNFNSGLQFTPASNVKLITLLACLNILDDSVTAFKYIEKGDSLIILPNADPSFLNSKIDSIQSGFNFIKSNSNKIFIVKNPKSDIPFYGNGWAWDDYNYSYQSCNSEFPLFGNNIKFTKSSSDKLRISPTFFSKNITYKKGNGRNILDRNEHENLFNFEFDEIPDNYEVTRPFIPHDETIQALLSDTLNVEVEIITETFDSIQSKAFRSIPSSTLYKEIIQKSDNFIAEQLLLMCSNNVLNYMNTSTIIKHIKDSIFQNKYDIKWVDGSGLSRYNLASPDDLVNMLQEIYKLIGLENVENFFATGLEDDTLDKIYYSANPWIFAKTGSLSNNYCLSGFIKTDKGNVLAFSFLNNHFTNSRKEIVKSVYNFLSYLKLNY
ncbi:MAG: hypothetical protein HKN51_05660 [Saprospiraceae bacterium]|nr:hypothetical protein [Saprospiraceae bacterium]